MIKARLNCKFYEIKLFSNASEMLNMRKII